MWILSIGVLKSPPVSVSYPYRSRERHLGFNYHRLLGCSRDLHSYVRVYYLENLVNFLFYRDRYYKYRVLDRHHLVYRLSYRHYIEPVYHLYRGCFLEKLLGYVGMCSQENSRYGFVLGTLFSLLYFISSLLLELLLNFLPTFISLSTPPFFLSTLLGILYYLHFFLVKQRTFFIYFFIFWPSLNFYFKVNAGQIKK